MKQYDSLAESRSWTTLLKSLPEDSTKVKFPDEDSVIVARNSVYYGDLRKYNFSFRKTDMPLVFEITKARI